MSSVFAPQKGCQPLESFQDSMAFFPDPVVSLRSTTGYGAAKPSALKQRQRRLANWKIL